MEVEFSGEEKEEPKQGVLRTDFSLLKWSNPVILPRKDDGDSQMSCEVFSVEKPKEGDLTEILNTIVPPREWNERGNIWTQFLSPEPSSRKDLMKLAEKLDKTLIEMRAREAGLCDIRRGIYSEFFDELIRQVTVNCAERGLLLLRVRDEAIMTIETYRRLYESSVAYGIRKALEAEEGKKDLEEQIGRLTEERDKLKEQLDDITRMYDENERRYAERRNLEEAKHRAQMEFLQKTNKTLKLQLESIIAPKK